MARYEDTMGARDAELDPPFTPALWLLLWVTLAAGFVEAYAVMGSYTFQSLPATSEFFFPKPVSARHWLQWCESSSSRP